MAETGRPRAAVESGNKGKIQPHYVTASSLAMNQEEADLQESGSSVANVENSTDSGIFYLNPLTPKLSCGISEKNLEATTEEEDGIWVQSKDTDARISAEKATTSELAMKKLNLLKAKKPYFVPQTSNGEISSVLSEEIGFRSQDNSEGRTFKELTPKFKLLKVQKHDLNQQPRKYSHVVSSQSQEKDFWVQSNKFVENLRTFCRATSKLELQMFRKPVLSSQTSSGIMENCSDILSSPSPEETEMWVQNKNDAEKIFARTSKITPKPQLIVKEEPCANPQSTNGDILRSEGQEKECFKSKNNSDGCAKDHVDKELLENDKLKDLQVKETQEDGVKVSANVKSRHDSKMSRLLEAMKKRGDIDTEQRPFKCPHCHWAFKKLCYLQSHISTHSGLKPHVCDICGKAYSHQGTLQQHKRLHTGERPYCCPFCDRSYIWSSDYRKHIRTHTGEKPYECKECGKDFIRSSDLRKHERNMHTNDKPFPCSHCEKTFNRPLSLKRHERKHLGERPYSCPDCGKKFALASRMAEHQKIHKGVRPFVCSVCAKCFTKSSNLTEHEAIHSGKRPHKCGECGVAFAMASRLVRHQYVHNKGKPYSCAGCSRNFSCLASLEQHQQLTCAGRIFVCVQCDKSFMCADKLAQHMQHHNDKARPN